MASPAGRRQFGLLLIILGGIGAALMLVRTVTQLYLSGMISGAGFLPDQPDQLVPMQDWLLTLATFAAFIIIIRYGRRMRRDARISDEPGDHSIS
ncbi:hypothetical protein [Hymenobacter sp. DG25A]|jgi:hypothetical protein|uniref:hypothetical protein n=1 Tax=Hymenobacter sp. DG25A TaxID=1385663 RepID=UPI0006BDD957|nr:hypothetical protein [Hymenobacter sp. DG25A]ALD20003.1 hypothetical protein AM218_00645 [Hymenobacter sp. DG25A]